MESGDSSLHEFFKHNLGSGTASIGIFKVTTRHRGIIAVKVATKEQRECLDREADILVGLDHPNVRKCIKKPNIIGEYSYLRLDYTPGCDLFMLLSERTPPIVRKKQLALRSNDPTFMGRVYILRCVLKAIQYIHSVEIVHNDIKLENVIVGCLNFDTLTEETPVKLIDFNLACRVTDMRRLGRGGSPIWCAPEKFLSRYFTQTELVDIFSFGILILTTLTLRMPRELQIRGDGMDTYEALEQNVLDIQRIVVDSSSNALGLSEVKAAILACIKFHARERKSAAKLLKLSLFV
jgi:serine/threonine protein kinase